MIFNRENNISKTKGSTQCEIPVSIKQIDSISLGTNKNQKNIFFPSRDTCDSLSFEGKSAQNDGKSSTNSTMKRIINFDQSLFFQHAQSLYESKVLEMREENGQNMMNNWDFSFNAQFFSNIYQQKFYCSKQANNNRSFLHSKINAIKNNSAILAQELIQVKKQLIRFYQQKKFIFDDIKAKISKKIGLCFAQLSEENRKLKNSLQSGLEDQKKSKQNQSFLSEKCLEMSKRICLLNESVLEKQEQIKQLKLKNQALIEYNEQLFKRSRCLYQSSLNQENQSLLSFEQFQCQKIDYCRENQPRNSSNEDQYRSKLNNLLYTLISCVINEENQVEVSLDKIEASIKSFLASISQKQERILQNINGQSFKNIKNFDNLKQVPSEIKYGLLTIHFLLVSTNSISLGQNLQLYSSLNQLLEEIKAMQIQKLDRSTTSIGPKKIKGTSNPNSSSSLNELSNEESMIQEIQEFEQGCDGLSLSTSRSKNKIELMHDKIQEIKKIIAGKGKNNTV